MRETQNTGPEFNLRGREFNSNEVARIVEIVRENQSNSRTAISKIICIELDWRQPNGWLKDRACREVLLVLEEQGLFKLPARRHIPWNMREQRKKDIKKHPYPADLKILRRLPKSIDLRLVKGTSNEDLWNYLVQGYHYLGHTIQVGRCLKYLVYGNNKLIGAISFSSPAWHLAPRDRVMKKLGISVSSIRDLVIDNSRFVIFPNATVKNLASKILSAACSRVVGDWSNYYSIKPLVAETFVEQERFLGTSYIAANWVKVGKTRGFSKSGANHHNSQPIKDIFLYGLETDIRAQINASVGGEVEGCDE